MIGQVTKFAVPVKSKVVSHIEYCGGVDGAYCPMDPDGILCAIGPTRLQTMAAGTGNLPVLG